MAVYTARVGMWAVLFVYTLWGGYVYASESNGTINVTNKLTKVCQNAACSSYSTINWKPTINSNTPGAQAVAITDTGLTGHVWGDSIGWVNLAPTGGGVTINPTTGAVSGKAFANVGSWINFSPTTVGGGTQVGVTINSSGQFVGWAYVSGVHGGWMKFDCAGVGTCIQTDWRPIPNRTVVPSGGGGGGGSGGGGGFFGTTLSTNNTQTTTQAIPPKPTTAETGGGGGAEAEVIKKCSMRTIPPGTRHADVTKIQAFLVQQGYLFAALDAKGYYGGGTRASIGAFQKKYYKDIVLAAGITEPTGRWAEFTAKKAKELGLCLLESTPLPKVQPVPVSTKTLCLTKTIRPGTRNSNEVRQIQRFLIAQGYTLVEVTGYYGPTTKQAISFFQKRFAQDILVPADLTKPTGIWGTYTAKKASGMGLCQM